MHQKNIKAAGAALTAGSKVLIMVHGRGGSAEDILSLSAYLEVPGFSLLAPQATNNTWYPYSFLMPAAQNEPWLSSALALLKDLTCELVQQGVPTSNIFFLGFSQGACLTLEFVARHAAQYGGVVAFTGGLIGDTLNAENYTGNLHQTPVFMGTSNPDPHVPVHRVQDTAEILKSMGAQVTTKLYAGMAHTISQDELDLANKLVFARGGAH